MTRFEAKLATALRDRAAEGFSDISPDWQGSTAEEQRIVQRVLKFEGTSKAITEFDRKCSRLGDYWYWFTLGTLWVNYTGWSALPTWKRLFGSERPGRASSLMKPSELRILQALPDKLTLYRAHRPGEQDWIAYTLNPETAARFARERGVDRVSVYLCPKDRVLALFLRRGEEEVLVLDKQDVTFLQEQKVVIV